MVVKLIYYPPIQIPIDDTADASSKPPSVQCLAEVGRRVLSWQHI